MKRLIVLFSALALTVAPACESDSDSNSESSGNGNAASGWSTGLDGSLALSDLTDEQQISACEASEAYGANWEAENEELMKSANCYISVSVMASYSMDMPDGVESEFDCQELLDQCLAGEGPFAEEPEEDEEGPDETCADQVEDFSECTEVTVAELEACSQAQMVIMEQAFQGFAQGTCADIEAAASSDDGPMAESIFPDLEDVPECAGLEEKCPALANEEDSGETEIECTEHADCVYEPYCDGDTLVEVQSGWCDPFTGTCTVSSTVGFECPDGCEDGACIGGFPSPEEEPEEPTPAEPPSS